MHILNDFFLLVWQEDARVIYLSTHDIHDHLLSTYKKDYETFCDYATIVLLIDAKNLASFKSLQEPKNALKHLSGVHDFDKQRVQYLQKELLFFLTHEGNLDLNKAIQKRIDLLRKEEIVGYEKARKLITVLALIKEKKEEATQEKKEEIAQKGDNFYQDMCLHVEALLEDMRQNIESKNLLQRVNTIPEKIAAQRFSIGVSGVMNAGKSTMLNALLQAEILGTSVVPETANLSILHYAQNPHARVNFWDQKEWQSIEESASTTPSLEKFVRETKAHFAKNFDSFIQKQSLQKDIKLDELANYTSAKHSDKLCNLVKSVELFSDLDFLKDGVSIVDTPGLDDPVVQREEITKAYLSECDLLIHLMNVNQSATQKDIEFLCDTILYQNVSQILIVITRIDTVSQKELDEVIAYTKKSIHTKLQSLNKENRFDYLISKLHFIPLAALMALHHYTGREKIAKERGYPLEKTGIFELRAYLAEVLFGKDAQKIKILFAFVFKEMQTILAQSNALYAQEVQLLGKSSDELTIEVDRFLIEFQAIQKKRESLYAQVQNARHELLEYTKVMQNFTSNKILQLQANIKRRVSDDVSYEMRKNKKRPQKQRIDTIIQSGIQDGYFDISRDYRHLFMQRLEEIFERLQNAFENFETNFEQKDAKEFFNEQFSDFVFIKNTQSLLEKSNALIDLHVKDIEKLDHALGKIFQPFFGEIKELLEKNSAIINEKILQEFTHHTQTLLVQIDAKNSDIKEMLLATQKQLQNQDFDATARVESLEKKQIALYAIAQKIDSLRSFGE
ncbi:MAG: dynamin family protein [Sulfurospirillum sp.]|nr:dynamin family protein [Sulfurospirillum sp.]